MRSPTLEIEYLRPPMVVCFSDCSPFWSSETERQLNQLVNTTQGGLPQSRDTIHWRDCSADSILAQTWIHQQPLVVMALTGQNVKGRLELIHRISHLRGKVVAIGGSELKNHRLPLTAAGTVALVTDIFECQRLALIIQRMAETRRAELTNWKTRFVNRLPWRPV